MTPGMPPSFHLFSQRILKIGKDIPLVPDKAIPDIVFPLGNQFQKANGVSHIFVAFRILKHGSGPSVLGNDDGPPGIIDLVKQ